MISILYSIIVIYCLLILLLIRGQKLLSNHIEKTIPTTNFSIIIPFRNEEENLPELLHSLKRIEYSKQSYEIILVNDDSSDKSVEIINKYSPENCFIIHNKRLTKSPKKDAIQTAIKRATNDWILTTDADCIIPKTWLSSLNYYIQKHQPHMVAAPVTIKSNTRFIEQFQMVDFLSMQGATIGGFGIKKPFMANGANLAYKKELFFKLNGFNSNSAIASGDDMFLLETFLDFDKNKVHFLKNIDALVSTKPLNTFKEIINQRLRWAAKTKHYNSSFTKRVGLLVFLTNIATIICYCLSWSIPLLVLLIFLKWLIDGLLIFKTANLYQQKINIPLYLLTALLHPFFTIYIVFLSLFKDFTWKERRFKA